MLRYWFFGSLITSGCLTSILWSSPVNACGIGDAIQNRRSLPDWDRVTYPTTDLLQKMNGVWEGDKQTVAQPVNRLNLSHIIWPLNEFLPPDHRHNPQRQRCSRDPDVGYYPVALVPEQSYGRTISAAPKLFIYIPPTLGMKAEFFINGLDSGLVREFTLPEGEGIIAINLEMPDRDFALESGKLYEWNFVIFVYPEDRSGDILLQGWVERIEPNPDLTTALARSANFDRHFHLAQAGLWHDVLGLLYELRQANSENIHYIEQWQQLLESVELGYLADKPIIAEF